MWAKADLQVQGDSPNSAQSEIPLFPENSALGLVSVKRGKAQLEKREKQTEAFLKCSLPGPADLSTHLSQGFSQLPLLQLRAHPPQALPLLLSARQWRSWVSQAALSHTTPS